MPDKKPNKKKIRKMKQPRKVNQEKDWKLQLEEVKRKIEKHNSISTGKIQYRTSDEPLDDHNKEKV